MAVAHISSITEYMNAAGAEEYLTIQSVSMLVGFITTFCMLLFTVNGDDKRVRFLVIFRILSLALFDRLFTMHGGDAGAAYAELAANTTVGLSALWLCFHSRYFAKPNFRDKDLYQGWMKRGVYVGMQIFLDNFIYAIMIVKMVNAVNESGNYWVANNFIWGWLIVPVTCFVEVVRKNKLDSLTMRNAWWYAIGIAAVWLLSAPAWRWFLINAMSILEPDAILSIIFHALLFYLCYIPSAIIDGWFVSRGKTSYLAANSAICNIIYYGILYILFQSGTITPSMNFIIRMFGWGLVLHFLVSVGFYLAEQTRMGNLLLPRRKSD